jgi:hypothetical protein
LDTVQIDKFSAKKARPGAVDTDCTDGHGVKPRGGHAAIRGFQTAKHVKYTNGNSGFVSAFEKLLDKQDFRDGSLGI